MCLRSAWTKKSETNIPILCFFYVKGCFEASLYNPFPENNSKECLG